jgi:beta-lactamase regulating signal transducer with metallopeptidase domain
MKSWLTLTLLPDEFQFLGALADATTKATLLLFVSWLIVILLRRQSAAVRHRVWALSIYGLITMPFLSWMVPGWRLVVFHAAPPTTAAILPATIPVSSVPVGVATPPYSTPGRVAVEGRPPVPATAVGERAAFALLARPSVRAAGIEPNRGSARETAAPWAAPGVLLAVWGLGAFVIGLPTLLGLIGNQRLRRRAQPVTGEDWLVLLESIRRKWSIRRNVELLRCEAAPIPLTWGVVRPVILLPADAPSWPEPKRRLVLLHEFAHILRFDAGVQLASRLASACYWFHPMVWYALHRLRLECEHACDDCVVLAGERPSDYASQLVELARSAREARYSVTIAMARTNVLEDRLKALFDDTRSHLPVDRRAGRLIAASAAALVLGLAMLHPVFSAAAPNGQTPPAQSNAAATSPAAEPVRKRTGRIAGRVVHGDGGAAAPAAEVVLLPPPPKGQDFYIGKRPLRGTTTGGDGAFSFDGLSPGRYGVWANLGKLSSRHRQAHGVVAIVPESGVAPKPVELRLVPAVRVTVRVKERATGKPIPNATVQPGWSDLIDDFTTDRDGQIHAQPFTPERWLLEVWADGFAKDSRWLNLENGADAEAEFLLDPGGDLEGVVRDPAGKPVAGVGLSIFPDGGNQQFAYVETDANGRYALWHLPRNVDMRILELGTGDYFHEAVPTRLTGRRHELNLTLRLRPHGGSIVGNVVDHKGRPIAGAELINPSNSSDKVRKAETGPDGRFRLENLYQTMVGKEVIVRAKGFAPRRVKVEPGPAAKPAEVTITLKAGHRLKGQVTDQKGVPLEGVRVYFANGNSPDSDGGSATTDAQGLFAFDSLPMNPPFSFRKEGYSEIANRNLPIDEDDVIKVEMVPAGVIVGTVIDATTGKPIRAFNFQVTFSPQSQPGEP